MSAEEILDLMPDLIPALDGSWLAVTPLDAPVRAGCHEPTEQAAREEFKVALRRIVDALDRVDQDAEG